MWFIRFIYNYEINTLYLVLSVQRSCANIINEIIAVDRNRVLSIYADNDNSFDIFGSLNKFGKEVETMFDTRLKLSAMKIVDSLNACVSENLQNVCVQIDVAESLRDIVTHIVAEAETNDLA